MNMVRSAEALLAMGRMATERMRNRQIANPRTGSEVVPRNVWLPRGAEAGLCLLFSCSLSHS